MENSLTNVTNCKNCDKQHEEGFEFCPHCGQKTNEDLTIGVLFYNTISNYFSFDARFFKSFIPLMFKPGDLAKRFIEGKRLLYLHPAQMYLFISVVFFFIISFAIRDTSQKLDEGFKNEKENPIVISDSLKPVLDSIQIQQTEKLFNQLKDNKKLLGINDEDLKLADSIIKVQATNPQRFNTNFGFDQKKVDSLIVLGAEDAVIYKQMGMKDDAGALTRQFFSQMLKFYKDRGAGSILQAFFDSIPIALFFLLPIFAFILKLFHYKKGRFAHHLVFSFYYFSFLFTAFSLLYGINLIGDIPDWIDFLIILSTFFYLFVAIKRFYNQGWFLSFVKSGVITFVYFMFLIPFTIFVGLVAFMLY